jgi:hypothetical protein
VDVELKDGTGFTGRIKSASDDIIVFEVTQGKTQEERTVAFVDITRGMVQVEFNRVIIENEGEVTDGH